MSWHGLRRRVAAEKHRHTYGALGVCERWLAFENFLADMGERPDGHTIDRIDNARGYEPGNCRWATPAEQNRNKGDTVVVDIDGERRCLAEWIRLLGVVPAATVYARVRKGWQPARALKTPKQGRRQ